VIFPEFPAFVVPKIEHMQLDALARIPVNPRIMALEPSSIGVSMHNLTSSKVSLESFTASQTYVASAGAAAK
jgi:hypothetical protein